MTQEIDRSQKPTGEDRQLQILNGLANWVQSLDEVTRKLYFVGEVQIPEAVFSEEMFVELVEIGTSEQVLDAAMSGIKISDSRDVVSPWDIDIIK